MRGIEWDAPAIGAVVADDHAAEHYAMVEREFLGTSPDTGCNVFALREAPGGGFVKLPAQLVTRLVDGDVSMTELQDWLVAAFIVRSLETRSASPTMTQLAELTGRGWRQLVGIIERLQDRGILTARKRPYKYAGEGKDAAYSARWEFALAVNSPARALLKDAGSRAEWRAVPLQIARDRSVTAVACYLVLAEQMRQDKCITTTPGDLARSLHVTQRTAKRILARLGARRVARRGRSAVYVMPGAFDKPLEAATPVSLSLDRLGPGVRNEHAQERLQARVAMFRALLARHRMDADKLEAQAIVAVARAGIEPTQAIVLRVLESLHLRLVFREPRLLSGVVRSVAGRVRHATGREHVPSVRQSAALSAAVAGLCSDCDGEGIIESTHRPGVFEVCPSCRT